MVRDPARSLMTVVRAYRRYAGRPGPMAWLGRKYTRLRHRWWSAWTGSDILLGATLGERLALPHPNGVVIHETAVIGDDCMIMQQVTLGMVADGGAPTLGSGVYVGAGAKILGPVSIGDRARIGANAVVLVDVPADCTATGVPATVRPTIKR